MNKTMRWTCFMSMCSYLLCGCSIFLQKRSYVKPGEPFSRIVFLDSYANLTEREMNSQLFVYLIQKGLKSKLLFLFTEHNQYKELDLAPGKYLFIAEMAFGEKWLLKPGKNSIPIEVVLEEGKVTAINIERRYLSYLEILTFPKTWELNFEVIANNVGGFLMEGNENFKENIIEVMKNDQFFLQEAALIYLQNQGTQLSKEILEEIVNDWDMLKNKELRKSAKQMLKYYKIKKTPIK